MARSKLLSALKPARASRHGDSHTRTGRDDHDRGHDDHGHDDRRGRTRTRTHG